MAGLNDAQLQAARAKTSVRITADANALIPAGSRIWAVTLTPAAAACQLAVYNAATVTGTQKWDLQAAANGSTFELVIPGGEIFDVGVSVDITGAGALGAIWYTNG